MLSVRGQTRRLCSSRVRAPCLDRPQELLYVFAQSLQLEVDRLQEKARLQNIKLKRAMQDVERFKEEASRLTRLHDVRDAEKQFVRRGSPWGVGHYGWRGTS